MGSMGSPAKAIDCLHFEPFPTRKALAVRVVPVDRFLIGVGERGALYTNISGLAGKYSCSGPFTWSYEVTEALLKLGVIDKEVYDLHTKYLDRENARREEVSAFAKVAAAAEIPGVVRPGVVKKMWDKLDWYGQYKYTRDYRGKLPNGCERKPQPKLPGEE